MTIQTELEYGCVVQPANEVAVGVTLPTGFLTLEDLLSHIDYQLKTDFMGILEDKIDEEFIAGVTTERKDQRGPVDDSYEFDGDASHRIQSAEAVCFAPQVLKDGT